MFVEANFRQFRSPGRMVERVERGKFAAIKVRFASPLFAGLARLERMLDSGHSHAPWYSHASNPK